MIARLLGVGMLLFAGGFWVETASAQTVVNCIGAGTDTPTTTSRVLFNITGSTCAIDNLGTLPNNGIAYYSGPTGTPDAHSFYGDGPSGTPNLPQDCTFDGNGPTNAGGTGGTAANQCRFTGDFAVGTYVSQADLIVGADTYRMTVTFEMLAANQIDIVSASVTINPVANTTDLASRALSQQTVGAHILFQQAGQNIGEGVGNAVAERFLRRSGIQASMSSNGGALSAYVSLHGIGQAAQDMRSSRLAMYDAPEAVQAIYEATGGVDVGVEGEEVSPYLLGADVVPMVASQPDTITWNAWVRGTYTHYDGDAFSGDTWNGVAGMDYLLTEDLLIGVLAGYENGDFDFDTTNGEFEGSGITAGIYVGARLSESIVADAFLTHSWLNYDTRAGTATGSTDASRWLVSMNVTGSYGLTDSLILEPNVRVFYAHETQDGYTLSDATVVAENSIDSGRLSLGPRLRYLVAEDWTAFISAHGEYNLSSETQTNTTLPDFDGLLSARVGLGIDGMFWNGWSLSLAGDVSGIGSGDYLAYTGTGKIRVPLN